MKAAAAFHELGMIQDEIDKTQSRIQDLINGILDTIDRSDFDHLAANWADLSCTEVKATEDGWEAIVEEACPIDRSIAEWIEGQLFDRGWANIKVKTEWSWQSS